jgi:hypothetical protein
LCVGATSRSLAFALQLLHPLSSIVLTTITGQLTSPNHSNIESFSGLVVQLYCASISRLRARAADGMAACWRGCGRMAGWSEAPGVAAGVDPKTISASRG